MIPLLPANQRRWHAGPSLIRNSLPPLPPPPGLRVHPASPAQREAPDDHPAMRPRSTVKRVLQQNRDGGAKWKFRWSSRSGCSLREMAPASSRRETSGEERDFGIGFALSVVVLTFPETNEDAPLSQPGQNGSKQGVTDRQRLRTDLRHDLDPARVGPHRSTATVLHSNEVVPPRRPATLRIRPARPTSTDELLDRGQAFHWRTREVSMKVPRHRTLVLLPERLAVCRRKPGDHIPAWATSGEFCSVTRSREEISIVCLEASVPKKETAERGWRGLRFADTLDFAEVEILAAVSAPFTPITGRK